MQVSGWRTLEKRVGRRRRRTQGNANVPARPHAADDLGAPVASLAGTLGNLVFGSPWSGVHTVRDCSRGDPADAKDSEGSQGDVAIESGGSVPPPNSCGTRLIARPLVCWTVSEAKSVVPVLLFPGRAANPHGTKAYPASAFRAAFRRWLADLHITILVVRSDQQSDDETWHTQLDDLADQVRRWSGNACEMPVLTESELRAAAQQGDRLIDELRRDAIHLAGAQPKTLLGQRARRPRARTRGFAWSWRKSFSLPPQTSRDLGLNNAAASNAVISAINSKDAISLALTGRTGKSDNHAQAVEWASRMYTSAAIVVRDR